MDAIDVDTIGEEVRLLEGIRTTRAIRRLAPDPVPLALVRKVCEAGTFAPSGGNRQPWRFVAVLDPDRRAWVAERYRKEAQGYVDDKLKEVFPLVRSRDVMFACDLLRKKGPELLQRVTRWSGLDAEEVQAILNKLEDRAMVLGLQFARNQQAAKVLDILALLSALALDFAYTGRLTG